MPTLNAASLQTEIHVSTSTLSNEHAEALLDSAINRIILHGRGQLSMTNLSGTAGSKSLTVNQEWWAGIIAVAVAIYGRDYKTSGSGSGSSSSLNVGVLGKSQSTSSSSQSGSGGSDIDAIAENVAHNLLELTVEVG